jgi:hypothetical protein
MIEYKFRNDYEIEEFDDLAERIYERLSANGSNSEMDRRAARLALLRADIFMLERNRFMFNEERTPALDKEEKSED